MDVLPILVGFPIGFVVWWFMLRKWSLAEDDRRRRELGLPPRKRR